MIIFKYTASEIEQIVGEYVMHKHGIERSRKVSLAITHALPENAIIEITYGALERAAGVSTNNPFDFSLEGTENG